MAIERERKFLVDPVLIPPKALTEPWDLEAGYFTRTGPAIRVTLRKDGKTKVCFKSEGGLERQEFEYVIPRKDAEDLIKISPTYLAKKRYLYEGWEIDCIPVFKDGLLLKEIWMAEWEEQEGKGPVPDPLPKWVEREVTGVTEYSNQFLAWHYGKK